MQEFADMIAMILDPQTVFDQRGDPLRGPQLRPVALRHGPFGQQTNEARFLLRSQPGGAARRRLGLERIRPAGSQRVPPPKHTAGVTTHSAADLMQGQFPLEESNDLSTTLFQRSRRTTGPHENTFFQDASTVLHYLCGCQ